MSLGQGGGCCAPAVELADVALAMVTALVTADATAEGLGAAVAAADAVAVADAVATADAVAAADAMAMADAVAAADAVGTSRRGARCDAMVVAVPVAADGADDWHATKPTSAMTHAIALPSRIISAI